MSTKKNSSNPRAVAVFEFTGDASKPSASRLVPVSYFYAGGYEDAGIYLAQPAPVALLSGTEYEVERAGLPAANYDVETAGRIGDAWIGYGDFKTLNAVSSGAAVSDDDARPRLTKKATTTADVAEPAAEKSKSSPDETATATKTSPLDDHDRPTLKRKATPVGEQQKIPDETAVISPMDDPDRPHLGHTEPAKEKPGAKHLVGTPADMQQMVAVSDATTKEPHPFAYTWGSKEHETRAEQKLIAAVQSALAPEPVRKAPQRRPRRAAVPVSRVVKRAPSLELTDVHISSFALTYENTPALVLTARTSEAIPRDVTVIAEVDIYNEPRILLTSVSEAAHRADTPEMHLIDAVDADGSNRASLLFELRGATDRQFALYRVSRGTATQTFVSGAVPYQPPIPAAQP